MNTKPNTANRYALPLALIVIATLAMALLFQSFNHSALSAGAQSSGVTNGSLQNSTISVTASGTATAKPDLAIINIGVQAQGATASEALDKQNQAASAMLAKLKELKVADQDVQTTSFSIYPDYGNSPNNTHQPQGYIASSNLTVKVQDITQTGPVLDALVAVGANTAGGISFSLKDSQQLQANAIADAVANSRPKAEAIAKQLGVSITGVSAVVEGGYNQPPMPMMAAGAMNSQASSVPVASGELTVNASVTVVYSYSK